MADVDERLATVLEYLTFQNQALMTLMTAQAVPLVAQSVSSIASLARSISTVAVDGDSAEYMCALSALVYNK